jgi:hypothetical protein
LRSPIDAYRAELRAGRMVLQRCDSCAYVRPPASHVCPQCLSERWRWQALQGSAVVEGLTWYLQPLDERFTEVPYNAVLVRLHEGVRMIANVEAVQPGDLQVGQRLTAHIATGRMGNPVLAFRPAGPATTQ